MLAISSRDLHWPLVYLDGALWDILPGVSKRLVDIDDDLLEEATAILGASTMKETVNLSLEAVVLAARRRRHADRLAEMRDLDLAEPTVMAGAWR
jgi:Arc/MetJ family transcription regulator